MKKSIFESLSRIFKRSSDITVKPDGHHKSTAILSDYHNCKEVDISTDSKNPMISKEEEPKNCEMDLMSEDSEESEPELIDINALFLEKPSKPENEPKEVKYINVFRNNRLDGDNTLEEKQNVMRELVLNDKLDLLSDMIPLNLLTEKEIDLLIKRLKPSQLLIISRVWPQLKTKICELLLSRRFLWLGSQLTKGLLPEHEDCCDSCDDITDTKLCCQVKDPESLFQVLNQFHQVCHMFSSLRCLRLFRFVISEETDEMIARMCPNLLHLDLTECKVNHWKHLSAKNKNLRHLMLPSTQINDEIFSSIVKNKRQLKTIVVNTTDITGENLSQLPNSIERLDIRCCHRLLPNYLKDIDCLALNRLKYLRIEVAFDDKTFAVMCSELEDLILLELTLNERQNSELFSTNGLKQISKLSKLRSLKLGTNIATKEIPLLDIFNGCPLITNFSIDGTDCNVMIKDDVLSQIADYWPLLRKIEFKAIDWIGKEIVDELTRLPNLSYLDLTECSAVNDNCLVSNIHKMPKLNYLVLDKCHRLTILTYNAVIEKALKIDSLLSVSFFRCSFFIYYIKAEELPKNIRLTIASNKSKRFITFDGIRVKIFRCEDFHRYLKI